MSSDDDAHAAITQAIQSARYNEAVVVTVNDDASPREIVLVACLDRENGGIIWKDAALANTNNDSIKEFQEDAGIVRHFKEFQEDTGIVRHLRTKKWALPMLNDHRRNTLYNAAIREACRRMVQKRASKCTTGKPITHGDGGKGGDATIRVLDIGSGTGLLAMMSARHALDAVGSVAQEEQESSLAGNNLKVQVTSVEMASAMARLARKTIDENSLSENIVVVEEHSTDVGFGIDDARFQGNETDDGIKKDSTTNEKADICTSELLESGLLGEGFLPSIRDAWKRHLKPDAIVVPRRARVFAVLIEGMPIIKGDNDSNDRRTLNAATAFFGPDLHAFQKASGGVWLSASAPSVLKGDESAPHHNQLNNDGILLGSQCCENTNKDRLEEGITVPLHANAMLKNCHDNSSTTNDDFRAIRPLTNPTMVLDFDFASGLDALPPPTGRTIATNDVIPTTDGVCDGVLFWWELDLWDGDRDSCTYSTEPIGFVNREIDGKGDGPNDDNKSLWQDHWQQCLFLFGDGHSARNLGGRNLTKGSPVDIIASHDDSSISFSVRTSRTSSATMDVTKEGDSTSRPFQRRRLNECNEAGVQLHQLMMNCHITTTRALQLNDSSRIRTLRAAIQYGIHVKGQDAPLLDVSDMGLCSIIASVVGATRVTSLESSSGTLPTLAATIAQIGNSLPKPSTEFQIIQALAEHITEEHIAGGVAEIVAAEPYYEMLEGWHLQEALNYFYLVRSLKARGVISPSALSVPAHARIMACVLEFDEFNSAYGPVGDQDAVAGFRHASVNYYGNRCHMASLPLWQYRYKQLTQEFCVARLSYEGAVPTIEIIDDSVELTLEGVAQAVVLWVEYSCRTNNATSNGSSGDHFDVISTASSSHRQIVQRLPEPIAVTEADVKAGAKFCCKASFGIDPGEIEDLSFSFEYCHKA
ncbi:hypothetical protein ACHAXR_007657 [Thalassiosira sp. AJA248-18]